MQVRRLPVGMDSHTEMHRLAPFRLGPGAGTVVSPQANEEISMQLGFSEEQQRRWLDDNHGAVQAKVPEPIVGYQLFYRTGSWGQLGAAHISPLAGTVMNMVGKRRAAGLPQSFMLDLTATRLYAFKYKSRANGIKMGDQL